MEKLSLDYIAGLIEGEGSFFWTYYKGNKAWVPGFTLRMHFRDKKLIERVGCTLGLSNPIYEYTNQGRHSATLIVRDQESLIAKIMPAFRGRLHGYKKLQFEEWVKGFHEKLGTDQYLLDLFSNGEKKADFCKRYKTVIKKMKV